MDEKHFSSVYYTFEGDEEPTLVGAVESTSSNDLFLDGALKFNSFGQGIIADDSNKKPVSINLKDLLFYPQFSYLHGDIYDMLGGSILDSGLLPKMRLKIKDTNAVLNELLFDDTEDYEKYSPIGSDIPLEWISVDILSDGGSISERINLEQLANELNLSQEVLEHEVYYPNFDTKRGPIVGDMNLDDIARQVANEPIVDVTKPDVPDTDEIGAHLVEDRVSNVNGDYIPVYSKGPAHINGGAVKLFDIYRMGLYSNDPVLEENIDKIRYIELNGSFDQSRGLIRKIRYSLNNCDIILKDSGGSLIHLKEENINYLRLEDITNLDAQNFDDVGIRLPKSLRPKESKKVKTRTSRTYASLVAVTLSAIGIVGYSIINKNGCPPVSLRNSDGGIEQIVALNIDAGAKLIEVRGAGVSKKQLFDEPSIPSLVPLTSPDAGTVKESEPLVKRIGNFSYFGKTPDGLDFFRYDKKIASGDSPGIIARRFDESDVLIGDLYDTTGYLNLVDSEGKRFVGDKGKVRREFAPGRDAYLVARRKSGAKLTPESRDGGVEAIVTRDAGAKLIEVRDGGSSEKRDAGAVDEEYDLGLPFRDPEEDPILGLYKSEIIKLRTTNDINGGTLRVDYAISYDGKIEIIKTTPIELSSSRGNARNYVELLKKRLEGKPANDLPGIYAVEL